MTKMWKPWQNYKELDVTLDLFASTLYLKHSWLKKKVNPFCQMLIIDWWDNELTSSLDDDNHVCLHWTVTDSGWQVTVGDNIRMMRHSGQYMTFQCLQRVRSLRSAYVTGMPTYCSTRGWRRSEGRCLPRSPRWWRGATLRRHTGEEWTVEALVMKSCSFSRFLVGVKPVICPTAVRLLLLFFTLLSVVGLFSPFSFLLCLS